MVNNIAQLYLYCPQYKHGAKILDTVKIISLYHVFVEKSTHII